jgi:hypothetical protein
MDVPCRRAVSIGALTLRLLVAVTSILFRAVAKMISELAAVVAEIARQHNGTRGPVVGIGSRDASYEGGRQF